MTISMNYELPWLPERPAKPRNVGITMVMDRGMSMNEAKGFVQQCADFTDFIKISSASSLITRNLKKKIEIYREAGLYVFFGGTLFESFVVRDMFSDYLKFVEAFDVNAVEISDGSIRLDRQVKCNFINNLSKTYTVISEVRLKNFVQSQAYDDWVSQMERELDAGAYRVVAEATDGDNPGIIDEEGQANTALIANLNKRIPPYKIIWEAPTTPQQIWFMMTFGSHVNLGNVLPADMLQLEALRLGLRGETLLQHLPGDLKKQFGPGQ
jgi:phosphosulfolactate synthase